MRTFLDKQDKDRRGLPGTNDHPKPSRPDQEVRDVGAPKLKGLAYLHLVLKRIVEDQKVPTFVPRSIVELGDHRTGTRKKSRERLVLVRILNYESCRFHVILVCAPNALPFSGVGR